MIDANDTTIGCSKNMNCCGLVELSGLQGESDPYPLDIRQAVVAAAAFCETQTGGAVFIFTENDRPPYNRGTRLTSLIRRHKFGRVVKTGWSYNSNSGDNIRAYYWTPNRDNIKKWVQKNVIGFKQFCEYYDPEW